MTPLTKILREKIEKHGALSVHDYMEAALSHPEYGYYTRQNPFGKSGDFVTAPEISQMFGELIGLWCIDTWSKLGEPAQFNLMELGPGNGTLLADALRSGALVPEFIDAAHIHLVETSDRLRIRQKAALSHPSIFWYSDIPDLDNGPTIIIANEFFDALPIHQYEATAGKWYERFIDWKDDQFAFSVDTVSHKTLPPPSDADSNLILEICPQGIKCLNSISQSLQKFGGAALIIDYGSANAIYGDSFQAVRDHTIQNPLVDPGMSDLTAHVKFPQLISEARKYPVDIHGPTSQGRFLERLGIEARAALLKRSATEEQRKTITSSLRRLTSAAEMGTLFKVLAISSGLTAPPEGFDL
ncbi:SAM-dependent methyltransferase [Sneathiella marina]|uniref:SAM-dependent methyltransferase n=1 Tax=Sneathiella marina TaxID=2950108 RepID=A0ABY4W8A7_9PROT|nr:SAM-dependent methyltransferase [Sneathiella marina]USG62363.1 SAM-dependent methyltransferase [Sneathiella marina]